MEKLEIIRCENPFNRRDRKTSTKPFHYGMSLLDIYCEEVPSALEVTISLNGKAVPSYLWDKTILKKGDQILIVPEVGDNDMLGTVLMIAVAVVVVYASYGVGSYLGAGGLGLTGGAYNLAMAGYFASAMFIGGVLVNALVGSPSIDLGSLQSESQSSVYKWNPTTTQEQGGVIPFCYGLHKVYGNIITGFLENEGTINYVNVLIALGMGPVNRIYDFKINDQLVKEEVSGKEATNFNGTVIEVRYGTVDQTIISNFNDTKVEFLPSSKIPYGSYYTYTTINNDFDDLEIEINAPNGLYYIADNGSYSALSVNVTVEYKKQGDSTWTHIAQQGLTTGNVFDGYKNRWSRGQWQPVYSDGEDSCRVIDNLWYEVEVGNTDPTSHYEGEVSNNNTFWRWINAPVYVAITTVVDYFTMTGNGSNEITKIFKAQGLSHGTYDIRVTRLSEDITNSRYQDDVYFSILREVYKDDFSYPRIALVGIKSLATENISGSFKFSCMLEGRKIRVYNSGTATWSVAYNNNPAWVCYDILTQPVYAADGSISRYDGYDPVYLDTASFSEWADWCDELVADGTGLTEKRITFNGVFDTSNESMWEAAIKVCSTARASLIWNGNIITVVIDKAGTEVQLFTIGNIGIDSFKETFLSTEDRAGSIEVEFTNATNDYEKDVYTLVDSNAGNADNKVSISLIGCTKPSEAWRAAKYRALCNQYLLRSIEFDVDIDAIACSVGDIVRVQHDVPQWGYGGRVVSATTDSVTIDQTVTIAAGSSYEIVVRLSDDTVVERTVTNAAGDHTVLTVSTPFDTAPAQFDVYAFGVVDVSYKPYRIVGMRRKTDLIIGIQAVEYNSNIYTVDSATPALPVSNYSALTPFVSITNLNVFYEIFTNDSESLDVKVTATWSVGTNTVYSGAKVYLRELLADGTYSGWVFKGETKSKDYSINGLKLGTTYEVGVVGINFTGVVTPFSGLVRKAVITNDAPAFYSNSLQRRVTGLQLFNNPNESSFTGKDCKVEWNAMSAIDFNTEAGGTAGSISPNVWLKDYEVRVYSSGTLRRTEYVLDTFYTYTYDKNYEDGAGVPVASLTIGVLARSKTGKVSLTENKLTVTNPAPSAVTNLTATPVVGGVVFEWDKNVEEDFQCYYIRTKVSTGSYSSWFKITDNKYTRVLTSAEIVLYGTNATIYIEVEALDLFNQASAAASANDEANTVSDNIFQLIGSKTGGTGNVSDLYDGTRTSGGVTF